MKTIKLQGPKDIYRTIVVDGKNHLVAGGTVTPDLPEGKVPENLFGLGFVVVPNESAPKAPAPSSKLE